MRRCCPSLSRSHIPARARSHVISARTSYSTRARGARARTHGRVRLPRLHAHVQCDSQRHAGQAEVTAIPPPPPLPLRSGSSRIHTVFGDGMGAHAGGARKRRTSRPTRTLQASPSHAGRRLFGALARSLAHPHTRPHPHGDSVHWCHICSGTGLGPGHLCTSTGTGLAPATSAPGLGSPQPLHICFGTGLTPALPHRHRDDWANRCQLYSCTAAAAASESEQQPVSSTLKRDPWFRPPARPRALLVQQPMARVVLVDSPCGAVPPR